MMKKMLKKAISLGLALACTAQFAACSLNVQESGDTGLKTAYQQYVSSVESAGKAPLAYEEWLERIVGDLGDAKKGVHSVYLNENGELVVVCTDGMQEIVQLPKEETHPHSYGQWIEYGPSANKDEYLLYRICETCRGIDWKTELRPQDGGEDDSKEEIEKGFWANLAENSVGGGIDGTFKDTGDIIVEGNPTAVEEYKGGEVTINFYHTMGQNLRSVLDRWIPEFNKIYPNITVKHNSYGAYQDLRDQITIELQVGKAPSLAYCYPDHVALYQKSGKVVALDDYISSTKTVTKKDGSTEQMGFTQAELNEFVRAYFEEGRVYGDNKVYTLPYEKSTEVLYYNKTFFEENNLSVPTTWDEMEMVMQQIKNIDPDCIPLGYDSEGNWFITMCQQLNTPYTSSMEGSKFLFDVSTNQEFVGRLREWYQRHWVTTEEIFGSYTSDLFTETDPDEVKAYMVIGSSALASYNSPDPVIAEDGSQSYPFEVGVAMPPQLDPNSPKVISQGPSICMFKTNSQEMAASWLFMKFLTTNLGLQAEYSMSSGYAPIIKNLDQKLPQYALDLEAADGNANLQATCVKQCLAQERGLFVSPAFWGSSAARDEVGSLIQQCLVNPLDGKTVAEFIDANFKAAIEKLRYNYFA